MVGSHPGVFRVASPFWYEARGARAIHAHSGAGARRVLRRLVRAGIRVMPTVTSTMSPRRAVRVLGRRAQRRAHIREIVRLARTPGYAGIDFNYEHLALTTSRHAAARVRHAFTTFVREACAALHRVRRYCIVTVMPRTGDEPAVWRGKLMPWVYDYEALGEAADRVRVMAYDQHAPGTRPGPVAGAWWVWKVARYAAHRAGARRTELGIPLYGYEWRRRGGARAVTWRQALALRARGGATRRWSRSRRAPWFIHPGGVVWYSDRHSTATRVRIARGHGLGGVAFWAPGGEDPGTWRAVAPMLR